MSKGKTDIIGLTPLWRTGKLHDAFRVYVFKNGVTTAIAAKVHPTLRQINLYLKQQKLRETQAEQDNYFQALKHRLFQELRSEHGLKVYKVIEKIELKTKSFNFEHSLDEFFNFKSDTGVSKNYYSIVKNVWLPFFIGKGCTHPKEFFQYKRQAQDHVKTAKKLSKDEQYSIHTRNSLTTALNQYLKFLCEYEHISPNDVFKLSARITLEQKKMMGTSQSRTRNTYSLDEMGEIKKAIDLTYSENQSMKVKAFALYFGLCTGLRSGNILGLKARNLKPDAKVPHYETNDNIISGWSRGKKGKLTMAVATKTSVGQVKLPLIMPSTEVLAEVARFLKCHVGENEYLLSLYPTGVGKLWKKIALECGFRYVNPHNWKKSYATVGAAHLGEWYKNNSYLFHKCCLHEDFRTTEKYIHQDADSFLEAFKK